MKHSKIQQRILQTEPPLLCPKPNCGGTLFIPHEDGWQCFNCMKITYMANEGAAKNSINVNKKQGMKRIV